MNYLTSSQIVYGAAGHTIDNYEDGRCHLCGGAVFSSTPYTEILKPTFTNHDETTGTGSVCAACVWSMSEQSEELQSRVGKTKPQRMRNYSHFVLNEEWLPVSKANKAGQAKLLLSPDGIPVVAVVAESGQRHLLFRSPCNPPGQSVGWVMFEQTPLQVHQSVLSNLLMAMRTLLGMKYSKDSIRTGRYLYLPPDLAMMGLIEEANTYLEAWRQTGVFNLALFLATIQEE